MKAYIEKLRELLKYPTGALAEIHKVKLVIIKNLIVISTAEMRFTYNIESEVLKIEPINKEGNIKFDSSGDHHSEIKLFAYYVVNYEEIQKQLKKMFGEMFYDYYPDEA